MPVMKIEIPPPWDEIDAKARRGLALLFGEPMADTQARYETQRRLIAETNALAEERAAEAQEAFDRMWHVPTLDERALALATIRHRASREKQAEHGRIELLPTLDELKRQAWHEIYRAEQTLQETDEAMQALAKEQTHD